MKKQFISATVVAGSIMATVLLAGAASADPSKCNGLSGYYGSNTAIIVGQDGRTVNVVLLNGGRPNAYGTCNGNQVTIDFTDDHVISGVINGTTISWDNNTQWTKAR